MSFSDIEASRQKGSMVNLFMLRYGSAPKSYFAYTDAEQPITHMDVVYLCLEYRAFLLFQIPHSYYCRMND